MPPLTRSQKRNARRTRLRKYNNEDTAGVLFREQNFNPAGYGQPIREDGFVVIARPSSDSDWVVIGHQTKGVAPTGLFK